MNNVSRRRARYSLNLLLIMGVLNYEKNMVAKKESLTRKRVSHRIESPKPVSPVYNRFLQTFTYRTSWEKEIALFSNAVQLVRTVRVKEIYSH